MLTLGFQGKEVVKSGDTVDPAGWQFELVRHVDQQVVAQEPEGLLRGVQHLDQGVLLVLKTFQGAIDETKARVAAWVFLIPPVSLFAPVLVSDWAYRLAL